MPSSPVPGINPGELGRALASSNDWRAIVIIMAVVMGLLIGVIIWDRYVLSRLHKSLDSLTRALWALKLQLARMDIPIDEHPDEP